MRFNFRFLYLVLFVMNLSRVQAAGFPLPPGSDPATTPSESAKAGGFPSSTTAATASKRPVAPKLTLDEKKTRLEAAIAQEQEHLRENLEALSILKRSIRNGRIIKATITLGSFVGLCVVGDAVTATVVSGIAWAGYEAVAYGLRCKAIKNAGLNYDERDIKNIFREVATALKSERQALKAVRAMTVEEIEFDSNGLPAAAESLIRDSDAAQSKISPVWADLNAKLLGLRENLYRKKPGSRARSLGIKILSARGELIEVRLAALNATKDKLENAIAQKARAAEVAANTPKEGCSPSIELLKD